MTICFTAIEIGPNCDNFATICDKLEQFTKKGFHFNSFVTICFNLSQICRKFLSQKFSAINLGQFGVCYSKLGILRKFALQLAQSVPELKQFVTCDRNWRNLGQI